MLKRFIIYLTFNNNITSLRLDNNIIFGTQDQFIFLAVSQWKILKQCHVHGTLIPILEDGCIILGLLIQNWTSSAPLPLKMPNYYVILICMYLKQKIHINNNHSLKFHIIKYLPNWTPKSNKYQSIYIIYIANIDLNFLIVL